MRLDEFDYDLPDSAIALRPASPRSSARLLELRGGEWTDHFVYALPDLLRPEDLLVVNNTKVTPARLSGVRRRDPIGDQPPSEAQIEATLTERLAPDRWRALAKPGKRLRLGDVVRFDPEAATGLRAEVAVKDAEGGGVEFQFYKTGAALDAAIALVGAPPLPPYIASRRAADAQDRRDYQTIFAKHDGAVAAPTASLHFDDALLSALDAAGVRRAEVTLHVGPGTFLPVTAEDPAEHRMHAEWGEIDETTAAAVTETRARGGRVVAVGTTALRVLETAVARAGEGSGAVDGALAPWRGWTNLFITPGYEFRIVDGLLTNFHLPRSTLLMLVAALVGRNRILAAYNHAIQSGYRFYSYGDATLLWREQA
ncbi:MAG: tRNA preQ1(34) S-adenosylmethionine ribosyltransferase-isomerase QueA [Rhodobacteraceae bacterium]|nr:tRNA preQ1(34) S-adenosylmethionine ribosyltransferase-isomerase QueA [Paracoccaceae bacterium]